MPPFEANNNFGTVTQISAEALGEPGKRTFRLLVESGAAFAQLWLEKEQLQQLAVYIEEINQEGPRRGMRRGRRREPEPTYDGGYIRLEFKVGSLSMGHDADVNSFLFLVHDRLRNRFLLTVFRVRRTGFVFAHSMAPLCSRIREQSPKVPLKKILACISHHVARRSA